MTQDMRKEKCICLNLNPFIYYNADIFLFDISEFGGFYVYFLTFLLIQQKTRTNDY